jgi:glutamate synthase domain-containing protein 3
VATQDPELRKRYTGKPEHVENYFRLLAEEVRGHMARLGFRTMDEMVGRTDMLETNDAVAFWKARGLDLRKVLHAPAVEGARRCLRPQEDLLADALDHRIMGRVEPALRAGTPVTVESPIRNLNRAVGTIISSRIAGRYGGAGLPDDTITLRFTGAAGQSFGAFCSKGMTLILEGEANDYMGKGLSGARIVLKPYPGARYDAGSNIVGGNVLLYGATGGEAYINGRVGQRFAIRNSGARAVVEGVGDHGCEYMTGGRVVVLGSTGVNFGAGMSGGIAYVFDETGMFDGNCNLEMVDLELVRDEEDERELRALIERHHYYTGSARAREMLDNWRACVPLFLKVFPTEYRRVLGQMSREDEATEREETTHE